MGWSFSIGRLFGSELRVHVTFLILLAWVGAASYADAGLNAAISDVVFVLLLFACVVAHEFGHALTARRYGIKTPDITLLPIGGLARLDRMPEKPSAEVAVAIAGPVVNLVIWLVLTIIFGANALNPVRGIIQPGAAGFIDSLAMVNLYLMAFNLLPAFPMDGGRVLRALLASRMGRIAGTEMASRIGQALAVAMGLYGLFYGAPILVLIAAFIFFAANAENADVAMTAIAKGRTARDAMITSFIALRPTDSLADASDAIIRTTQHEFPITDHQGNAVGYLTRQAVFAAVASGKTDAAVSEHMITDIPVLPAHMPLSKILEALPKTAARAVLATDPTGRVIGYVTQENLGEMMVLAPKG